MKKLIYLFVAVAVAMSVASCSKSEKVQQWEYKTLEIVGTSFSDFYPCHIEVPQGEMNRLGAEGWELVDVYTRVGTVHPNFGNEKYVTGLQPNVRTTAVYYVFKRPKFESDGENKTVDEDAVAVEEVEAVVVDSADIAD